MAKSSHTINIIPVLLCGGSGSRLWPLSQDDKPKQFLPIIDDETLLEKTIKRVEEITTHDIVLVTTQNLEAQAKNITERLFPHIKFHFILEQEAKGTTAAIALATLYIEESFSPYNVVWVMPTDHIIGTTDILKKIIKQATSTAISGEYIVTLGIPPDHPSTAYGYIKPGSMIPNNDNTYRIEKFIEKPSIKNAQTLLKNNNIYWNSGMFIASVKTFKNVLDRYAGDTLKHIENNQYHQIDQSPFDISIMEQYDKCAVIPTDIDWHDIGQWEKIWDLNNKDSQGNHINGDIITEDTENCFIQSESLLIATMGLKDLIIVEHDGKILIADKNNDKTIKELSEQIKKYNKDQL